MFAIFGSCRHSCTSGACASAAPAAMPALPGFTGMNTRS
jgi:hypothetical protein